MSTGGEGWAGTRLETEKEWCPEISRKTLSHMSNHCSGFILENLVSGLGVKLWGPYCRNSSQAFWCTTHCEPEMEI